MACIQDDTISNRFDTEISFKVPKLVNSKSFQMNRSKNYTRCQDFMLKDG